MSIWMTNLSKGGEGTATPAEDPVAFFRPEFPTVNADPALDMEERFPNRVSTRLGTPARVVSRIVNAITAI